MSWCARCEGWGCNNCMPEAKRLERLGGEQGLDADELETQRLRNQVRHLEHLRAETQAQVEQLTSDYLQAQAKLDALRELLARNGYGPHDNPVETVLETLADIYRLRLQAGEAT